MAIDAHGLKIQGRGYLKFLPNFLGGSRVSDKIARGSPYFGFIAFLLTSVLKFAWGVLYLPSPSSSPLVCIYEGQKTNLS
jgi:hypothetical protein